MTSALLDGLPGADLIEKGLADKSKDILSPESCLVEMASPRLATAGLLPEASTNTDSELTLYSILGEQSEDPYPLYNSLCRRLVSFEQALDHRMRQTQTKLTPATSEAKPNLQ